MPNRYDVIGCKITQTTLGAAIGAVVDRARSGEGGYVCFANAHSTVTARSNPALLAALDESFMTLPDGKPLYWVGKTRGLKPLEQISGPDFLPAMLADTQEPPLRHYFYGSTPETLDRLIAELRRRFPGTAIVGWESPPFRPLTDEEDELAMRRIAESGANLVWVGLGAPKQELWMVKHAPRLKPALLLGVGAAFDFHASRTKRAPQWVRAVGMEWFHRLLSEPRRLWKRYLKTNSLFILYWFRGLFHRR